MLANLITVVNALQALVHCSDFAESKATYLEIWQVCGEDLGFSSDHLQLLQRNSNKNYPIARKIDPEATQEPPPMNPLEDLRKPPTSKAGDFSIMAKFGRRMVVITAVLFLFSACGIGGYIQFFVEDKVEGALTMKREMQQQKNEDQKKLLEHNESKKVLEEEEDEEDEEEDDDDEDDDNNKVRQPQGKENEQEKQNVAST